MKIPRTIHYCWFGGGSMKPLAERCVAEWSDRLPGYQIQRWDETNAPINEPCLAESLRFRKYALASDFVRAWALEREGGIYLDVDVEIVRPFDNLLEEEAFIGFQEEHPGGQWRRAWIATKSLVCEGLDRPLPLRSCNAPKAAHRSRDMHPTLD